MWCNTLCCWSLRALAYHFFGFLFRLHGRLLFVMQRAPTHLVFFRIFQMFHFCRCRLLHAASCNRLSQAQQLKRTVKSKHSWPGAHVFFSIALGTGLRATVATKAVLDPYFDHFSSRICNCPRPKCIQVLFLRPGATFLVPCFPFP